MFDKLPQLDPFDVLDNWTPISTVKSLYDKAHGKLIDTTRNMIQQLNHEEPGKRTYLTTIELNKDSRAAGELSFCAFARRTRVASMS